MDDSSTKNSAGANTVEEDLKPLDFTAVASGKDFYTLALQAANKTGLKPTDFTYGVILGIVALALSQDFNGSLVNSERVIDDVHDALDDFYDQCKPQYHAAMRTSPSTMRTTGAPVALRRRNVLPPNVRRRRR